MYDYGKSPRYPIENVDHEIHILGVKIGYFPYLLWAFLLGLIIGGPLLGFGGLVLVIGACRYCYKQEERGEPLILSPRLMTWMQGLPRSIRNLLTSLLPALGSVEFPQPFYRE